MAVVKAISTQELAALANRLRLTLIRDRMEEMLTMAVDKKLRKSYPTSHHGGSFSCSTDVGRF